MPMLFNNIRILPAVDAGSGGWPFHYQHQSPGFALVGLVMRAGDWIDQVTPVFAELLDDGTTGPEIYGPSFGGAGGMTREVRVQPGHLVTGIQTRSGNYIDAIRLLETKWDGQQLNLAESKWTPWVGGWASGGVERQERIIELSGTGVAVGIAGRCGYYVDNLTLIAAELVKVTGTTVPKSSGRGARAAALTS
jgi:hypothetical protein